MAKRLDHNIILSEARGIATARGINGESDADFMARIEAICLMRHIGCALGLDEAPVLRLMQRVYPQFARRIHAKADAEQSRPLVRALRRFVYGYMAIDDPIGPDAWRDALARYEAALPAQDECAPDGMAEPMAERAVTDEVLYARCEAEGEWPVARLKRRAAHSRLMQVAHLRALATNELARLREAADERQLRSQLKTLNEEIIPDILPVRISSTMSVATLCALDTIYDLRSQLAYETGDPDEPVYANLHTQRSMQVSMALKHKYRSAKTLSEKIEILERIETIALTLTCDHSEFAMAEADRLLDRVETPFQRQRLSWLPSIDAADCDALVDTLLPQVRTPFDIATLALVIDFCDHRRRRAIVDRYKEFFAKSLSEDDADALGKLLVAAVTWNVHPDLRQELRDLTTHSSKPIAPEPFPAHYFSSSPKAAKPISFTASSKAAKPMTSLFLGKLESGKADNLIPNCISRLNDIAAHIYGLLTLAATIPA